MKTKLFALILLMFAGVTSQTKAQISECAIEYSVDVKGGDMDPMAAAMMEGMTMTMMFKDDKARVEMDMSMGKTISVVDAGEKKGVVLMDMMGMKMAMPMGPDEFADAEDEDRNPDVKITNKTKKIAGYTCKQAIITDEDGSKYEIWYTPEIKVNAQGTDYDYGDIDGFPLEMETKQDDMKVKMVAQDVSTKKLDNDLFDMSIPAGYTEMTPEMMKQMGGN